MGFYLETPKYKNKAKQLIKMYDAREVRMEEALDAIYDNKYAVICVISNPNFDAAAFCYDLKEFRRFNHVDDDRPRRWLIIEDRDMVDELSGYKATREKQKEMQEKIMTMVDVAAKNRRELEKQ
jgi:hypothetical protein